MTDPSKVERFYEKWCRTRFPLPAQSEIDALEDRLEATFPREYHEFLLRYNGGFFDEPVIVPGQACAYIAIKYLHGIHATYAFAELGLDANLFDDNQPAEIVPIGCTPGNNLLFMVVYPEEGYGSIG